CADFGLGNRLSGDLRLAAEPPHVLFPRDLADVELDGVARHYGLAELGLVDGEEINVLGMIAPHLRQHADGARGLRDPLDEQYARKAGIPGEVPRKLWFVDGDILAAPGAFIAAHLDDGIAQEKGVAMRQLF